MSTKRIVLQKIVFPEEDNAVTNWQLFYRGPRLVKENKRLLIPDKMVVDFASYLNGLSYRKWHLYTGLNQVSLCLKARGKFTVKLTGYSLKPIQAVRTEYHSQNFDLQEPGEVVLSFPEIQDEFITFEFISEGECEFFGGYYFCDFESGQTRSVNLAIATTTFKKEDFIKRNIDKIRSELLEGDDDIRNHLFVNVVDNGRTLKKDEIESPHIRLFYNDNVGGSGGFSRGMLESIHMVPEITNVLLMDDDVMVLPESIRRTYTLLTVLKEEYRQSFISGTMLELDAMWVMHEDIGLVKPNKDFFHAKPIYTATWLSDVLQSNREVPHHNHMYCGWWYCCIPAKTIKERGLSLPLFIRGDDVEYGLRCNPHIITMSGICVWHMGFAGKFSVHTNYYQEFRNMLIVKDAGQKIPDVDVYGRWKQECMRTALTFDYGGWEVLLLALEDYMKGPSFIEEDHGTEILQRNKKYSEKMEPLSAITGISMYLDELFEPERQMSFFKKVKYYLTWNGQRWMSEKKLDEEPSVLRQDWDHKPDKNGFHKKLLVVDHINRTGHIRKLDREKFRELLKRQKKDMKLYQRNHAALEQAYKEAYPYMISEEFWKKYLKLE